MEKLIQVQAGQVVLEGMLNIPAAVHSLVLFAHGSGSSRLSPRNNYVAQVLNKAGIATLLIDLLSLEEDADYAMRFDIDLLVERLAAVVQWLRQNEATQGLNLGLFGSSTGAAAALQLAASLGEQIKAVVSRGGRTDLASAHLPKVVAPTLFIVGECDHGVMELNQAAYEHLICQKEFVVIPTATHLFEEQGCLEEVARVAAAWFKSRM